MMALTIYVVGFIITLLIFMLAVAHGEKTGQLHEPSSAMGWGLFLCVFWPVIWIFFALDVISEGLMILARKLYEVFDK